MEKNDHTTSTICFLVIDKTKKRIINVTSFIEFTFFKNILEHDGCEVETRMSPKCIEEHQDYKVIKILDLFADIKSVTAVDGKNIFLRIMRKITNNIANLSEYVPVRDIFNEKYIKEIQTIGEIDYEDKHKKQEFFLKIFVESIGEYMNKNINISK